jgi:low temperature requirement protein LtrA
MLGWLLLLVVPDGVRTVGFLVMVLAELAVPIWAERGARTPWHPSHISERFGLFTLIVLGESVLSATLAIQSAFDEHDTTATLVGTVAGAPLVVFAMWWTYFARSSEAAVRENRVAFVWGYGHLVVFASAAAVGAGLAVAVDHATGDAHTTATAAAAAVTVPVAVFWLTVYGLHLRLADRSARKALVVGVTVARVLLATFVPQPVLVTGLVLAASTAVSTLLAARSRQVAVGS